MRDLIWTIIGVWVIWKIIDAFRNLSASRNNQNYSGNDSSGYRNSSSTQSEGSVAPKKGELKPDAGEYVDYEEIK